MLNQGWKKEKEVRVLIYFSAEVKALQGVDYLLPLGGSKKTNIERREGFAVV